MSTVYSFVLFSQRLKTKSNNKLFINRNNKHTLFDHGHCDKHMAKHGAVVVVIIGLLDLQLHMQSVPITTDVVSTALCDKVCQ